MVFFHVALTEISKICIWISWRRKNLLFICYDLKVNNFIVIYKFLKGYLLYWFILFYFVCLNIFTNNNKIYIIIKTKTKIKYIF